MDLSSYIDRLLSRMVEEDIGQGDATSLALIPADHRSSAKLICKEACIPAALTYLAPLLKKVDENITATLLQQEGSWQPAGTPLANITGPTASLLSCERIILNLISHASGVATLTRRYVKVIEGLPCTIFDTRKTLPGLRALEKYAVTVGGGKIHRLGLFDRFVIKIHHQKICGSLLRAIQLFEKKFPTSSFEIELNSMDDLECAQDSAAEAIIVMNFYPHQVEEIKRAMEKQGKKAQNMKKLYVESAGLITLDTVRNYAEKGADGICVGAITHSIRAIDFTLRY